MINEQLNLQLLVEYEVVDERMRKDLVLTIGERGLPQQLLWDLKPVVYCEGVVVLFHSRGVAGVDFTFSQICEYSFFPGDDPCLVLLRNKEQPKLFVIVLLEAVEVRVIGGF